MKHILFPPLRRIFWQLLLLFGIYFISRCAFTLINLHQFEGLTAKEFFSIAFFSLRYDISALLVINALYILLMLLPLPMWKLPRWEPFTQWLFIITNTIPLLFEVSDWAYFPYNFKRSTADVLNMVSRKGDFWSLLPRFLLDYWYVPIALAIIIVAFIKINKRIRRAVPLYQNAFYSFPLALVQLVMLAMVSGILVIGIRGGLQYVPIGTRNAVQVTKPQFTPIVINTPFSIISTFQNDEVPLVKYFPDSELPKYFNIRKQYAGTFKSKNVVLIIVESFSKEFTKLGNGKSYTPFIDSLMDRSLTCTAAYANALHSAEGIPAIVAGIPSLLDEPVSTSIYSNDHFSTLPNILKTQGYSSAFYHGGTNGTMSFDVFCAGAGYDKYYGRTEYNNENDYDGNWGIWDEPYLQYFAHSVSTMKQPFFATVFTLSSHPPYNIPPQYDNTFPKDTLPIHACISYTDMSLRKFFQNASQQPWYNNTLFIITADHCSPMSTTLPHNMDGYAIPIIYYAPGDTGLKNYNSTLTQQIDILPTVLNYVGYNKPFFAYGNSIFHNEHPYTINYINNMHQLVMNGHLLQTVNLQPVGLYSFPADSLYKYNLVNTNNPITQQELTYLKAFIQLYDQSLIYNKMWISPTK